MSKSGFVKILSIVMIFTMFNMKGNVQAMEKFENIFELGDLTTEHRKVAYLTFDDGPSIYTDKLLGVLNAHEVPGIFFVLGDQFNYVPQADVLLSRMVEEGHFVALHTMTHDKHALYRQDKSPSRFTDEMLELRDKIKEKTGHDTTLCRAPYGKSGHFQAAHYKAVANAGLYCVDWHIDSQDWAKQNADQIYEEVESQLEKYQNNQEIVLLFHEYQRTVDVLPRVIELLKSTGYTFEPYVEGKIFEGLD